MLIASHDETGIREKIIDIVNRYSSVTCAGKYKQNTDELGRIYGDDKMKYLRLFRFNICPENTLGDGYMTEKIFDAIRAGCIPIYWGENLEPGILNPEAILRYEEGQEKEFEDKIRMLMGNTEAYRQFATIPPFAEGAAQRIWEILQGLEDKLRSITK